MTLLERALEAHRSLERDCAIAEQDRTTARGKALGRYILKQFGSEIEPDEEVLRDQDMVSVGEITFWKPRYALGNTVKVRLSSWPEDRWAITTYNLTALGEVLARGPDPEPYWGEPKPEPKDQIVEALEKIAKKLGDICDILPRYD